MKHLFGDRHRGNPEWYCKMTIFQMQMIIQDSYCSLRWVILFVFFQYKNLKMY